MGLKKGFNSTQDKNNLSQGTKSGEQLARVPLSTWESSETPKVFPKQIQDEPPAAKHTFRGCPAGLFSCLISLMLTPVHISKAPTPGPPLGTSEMTIRSSLQGGPEHSTGQPAPFRGSYLRALCQSGPFSGDMVSPTKQVPLLLGYKNTAKNCRMPGDVLTPMGSTDTDLPWAGCYRGLAWRRLLGRSQAPAGV